VSEHNQMIAKLAMKHKNMFEIKFLILFFHSSNPEDLRSNVLQPTAYIHFLLSLSVLNGL
jgi:hypothetical protein